MDDITKEYLTFQTRTVTILGAHTIHAEVCDLESQVARVPGSVLYGVNTLITERRISRAVIPVPGGMNVFARDMRRIVAGDLESRETCDRESHIAARRVPCLVQSGTRKPAKLAN